MDKANKRGLSAKEPMNGDNRRSLHRAMRKIQLDREAERVWGIYGAANKMELFDVEAVSIWGIQSELGDELSHPI